MKIQIIGCSGSGKTFLANAFANKYQLPHLDLDDIFWDNRDEAYHRKYEESLRQSLLEDFLQQDNWVIEGVYYQWTEQVFEDADHIYLLDIPRRIYIRRIILRYLKRRLHLEPGTAGSFPSLISLIQWTEKFQRVHLPKIRMILEQQEGKVQYLTSISQINRLIEKS